VSTSNGQEASAQPMRNSGLAALFRRWLAGGGVSWLIGLALSALFIIPSLAQAGTEPPPLRIGVLAFRGFSIAEQQWKPLVRYLEERVPGQRFELRGLFVDELTKAIEQDELDFVLTQPEHYIRIQVSHGGFAPIATLTTRHGEYAISSMGSAIIRRADRADIASLADLRGARIAAAREDSAGSFLLPQWTLLQAGIDIKKEATLVFTGQPQDLVVEQVLQGKVDAGFVRSGLIEALIAEGKLAPDALAVVNPRHEPDFPLRLSTPLIPDWPFLANQRVPAPITKTVALALWQIPPDSLSTPAGDHYSFSPPSDYSPLETIMRALRTHPGSLAHIDLQGIIAKYPGQIALLLSTLLLLAFSGIVFLVRSRRQIRAALRERASILDNLGEGVMGLDHQGRCAFINPKALEILGSRHEEAIGCNLHAQFHRHHPNGDDYPASDCPIYQCLSDGQHRQGEEWYFRSNGEAFPAAFSATSAPGQPGQHGVLVVFRDISEERRADETMRIAAIAFEAQEGMLITDADKRILRVNKAFTRITGYTAEEAIGQTPALLKSGHHDAAFYQDMWASLHRKGRWKGEIWNRRKNGEFYPEWLSISTVRDRQGKVSHYVAAFLDITQRKKAEERVEFLAYYDELTRLPNRSLLNERLLKTLAAGRRHQRHSGLLFIDLDNFKMLNDTLGHAVGDSLLIEVANRLRQSVRASDTVARLGGDEFVILLEDLSADSQDAVAQIRRATEHILTALGDPYRLDDMTYRGSVSIGVVPFRSDGATIESLFKSADMAMYKAKAAGKNTMRFFDPAMQLEVEQRVQIERELHQALAEGQFILYLQSQVDRAGKLLGAEALIRWRHPQRGIILPGEFIPAAESTRLILPLGQWVLHEACRQLARWQSNPATAGLTLAVNVSAVQFRDSAFIDNVALALSESGARPASLKLEITESLLLENMDEAITRMRTLKDELGVRLSLDDFGTGYSSLSYLQQLPLDQIKLDRSFVDGVDRHSGNFAIANAVIALGRAFNLSVIAEGVETIPQRDILLTIGCEAFQGYLYSRPVAAAEFAAATGISATP